MIIRVLIRVHDNSKHRKRDQVSLQVSELIHIRGEKLTHSVDVLFISQGFLGETCLNAIGDFIKWDRTGIGTYFYLLP